jgi:hypothetical protein
MQVIHLPLIIAVFCSPLVNHWAQACDGVEGNAPNLLQAEIADVSALCLKSTKDNRFYGFEPDAYIAASSDAPETRWSGIEMQAVDKNGKSGPIGYPDYKPPLETFLKKYTQSAPNYPDADIAKGKAILDLPAHPAAEKLTQFGPSYSCGVMGNDNCKNTFYDLTKDASARLANIVHPQSFAEFVTDPNYSLATNRMAALIYNKALKVREGKLKNPGDFYQDLETSFSSLGLSKDKTDHMVWTFMNVMTTQGASFQTWERDRYGDSARAAGAALGVIVSTAGYLDAMTRNSGKMYSIPATIQTHCDYARPYHFWLAASLARELKAQGHSDGDILHAVHDVESIYEQFGPIFGGSPTKLNPSAVIDGDLHSAYNVETQKNIVYNDFGALWGIHSMPGEKGEPTLDLDASVRKAYNNAGTSTAEEKAGTAAMLHIVALAVGDGMDSKVLFQWKQRIVPDQSYNDLINFTK